MHRFARSLAVGFVAVIVSLSLTACQSPVAACPISEGGASASVTVNGPLGHQPSVSFPQPLVAAEPHTALDIAGNGPRVSAGDYVDFDAVVYRGNDALLLTATSYAQETGGQRLTASAAGNVIAQSFLCHHVGDRFVLTGTAEQIFGVVNNTALHPADTVVVVFDVNGTYPHAATGTPQLSLDGMPAVTTAVDGHPGLAMPQTSPPTDLRIETRIRGNGAVVAEGDRLVVHYVGAIWDGPVFDSSWDNGSPANFVAQNALTNGGVGVIPGVAKALIGQTIGSQVVVVVPPTEGYPTGQNPQNIPAGSTLVFVLDILGTTN